MSGYTIDLSIPRRAYATRASDAAAPTKGEMEWLFRRARRALSLSVPYVPSFVDDGYRRRVIADIEAMLARLERTP